MKLSTKKLVSLAMLAALAYIAVLLFRIPLFTGPMEFLQLIDNAQYVFTNSFHGCVFSVLFEKAFIAFGRNHSDAVKQTSRIETLLQVVGAQDSFCQKAENDFQFPNTDNFENAIAPLRQASREYLTNCLAKRE